MNILTNAVEAIQVGLEDFKSNDPRRAHSALRNIFAGMLLLFKEKLSQMSPANSDEILIRQNIVPAIDANGQLFFQGKGNKTVDVQQIKDRFKEFEVKVNWRDFDEINILRNNIEHYYAEESPSLINEVVSKSFKIIRDFCVTYLREEPADLFGTASWNIFLETNEVYETEKTESIKSLSKVDWTFGTLGDAIQNLRCPYCGSDLIHATQVEKYEVGKNFSLNCKKCQEEFDLEDVMEECIKAELAGASHIAGMDGSEGPYVECPECFKSTYIFDEGCCLVCGYEQEEKSCGVCGTSLGLEEAHEGGLCSYHQWVSDKSDD
ncbi:hypothetical protein AAKU52_002352 [Pedobacter sp. CG_S7]|uniref:hypothetical protein n=1 Tax=Pedobacter sp. CG_S7 TaxID=3143930 RepID=UPI003391CF58